MADFWGSVKKGLTDGIKTVSAKTEELTRVGRLKIEVIAVKRDIEKSFIEFGGKIYHRLNKTTTVDLKKDEELQQLVTQIKTFEKKLKKLEKDIEKIQSEARVSPENQHDDGPEKETEK